MAGSTGPKVARADRGHISDIGHEGRAWTWRPGDALRYTYTGSPRDYTAQDEGAVCVPARFRVGERKQHQ